MGHRNMRMKYNGHPRPRETLAYPEYGPPPGKEMDAVAAHLRSHLPTTVVDVAADVGILEQDAWKHLKTLEYQGSCVIDGDLVYAL